ncbi:MAG: hypothetical protein WBF13_08670 [Candidatus Zixiibacteriota bacterium]
MKTRGIAVILAPVLVLLILAGSASAQTKGTAMNIQFCNKSNAPAHDLRVVFNGPVNVPGDVTGDYSPFTYVTNQGTNVVKFADPVPGPLDTGSCTGAITFTSTMDNLQIDTAYWSDQYGNLYWILGPTEMPPCGIGPSLTFWGLIVLAALVAASGVVLIRRKRNLAALKI